MAILAALRVGTPSYSVAAADASPVQKAVLPVLGRKLARYDLHSYVFSPKPTVPVRQENPWCMRYNQEADSVKLEPEPVEAPVKDLIGLPEAARAFVAECVRLQQLGNSRRTLFDFTYHDGGSLTGGKS